MIKHSSLTRTKKSQMQQNNGHFLQFQTFQVFPNDTIEFQENRDSLLYSHSRKAQEYNKQWNGRLINVNKQTFVESQLLRSRTSSRGAILRLFDTVKDNSQGEIEDPLTAYVIAPFQLKPTDSKVINKSSKCGSKRQSNNLCCKQLQEKHRKQIKFLTINNQELYEEIQKHIKEKKQLVDQLSQVQTKAKYLKEENSLLIVKIEDLKQKICSIEVQYKNRELQYLKEKKNDIIHHEQQHQIFTKLSTCLKQKYKICQQQSNKNQQFDRSNMKRSKTQYYEQTKNNNTDLNLIGNESTPLKDRKRQALTVNTKYTDNSIIDNSQLKLKLDKKVNQFSKQKQRKFDKEITIEVQRLSKEKKKIIQSISKENVKYSKSQRINTESFDPVLDKFCKSNVGKFSIIKNSFSKGNNSKTLSTYGATLSILSNKQNK